MNHSGEVQQLAAMAQPTVAVVNNAQREHQEFMHTVEAVARENGAVLLALPSTGTAVFPADDAYSGLWQAMAGEARVWRFSYAVAAAGDQARRLKRNGANPVPAEVQGHALWLGDRWELSIESPVGRLQTQVHLPGRHNVHNAMAAASAALAAGATLDAVAQGLDAFRAVNGRSRLIGLNRHGRAVALIDDTYNANPDSVRAAIEVLAEMPAPRALILGDMGEVGEQGPAFHAEVGEHARRSGVELFLSLGALCAHAAQAYGPGARHFDSMETLTAELDTLPPVSSVLVKGSRFMRMERVVAALQAGTQEAC
jgi:UDP-N-acetylmuramoyl-tripeptide--D-alanyl-D-alanine ligase